MATGFRVSGRDGPSASRVIAAATALMPRPRRHCRGPPMRRFVITDGMVNAVTYHGENPRSADSTPAPHERAANA
jgi:hypothetical protein